MNKRKWIQRLTLLVILSVTMNALGASANGSSGYFQNRDEQIQIEKALIELEGLRNIKRLNKEQVDALNQKVTALEDLVKIERRRADAYKAANMERAEANRIDDRRLQTYEKFIEDFKTERARLTGERDAARRNGRLMAIGGFLLGAALVLFGQRK